MKIPIIIYNNLILKSISLFVKARGVTIFPFIILRKEAKFSVHRNFIKRIINHESIHIEQQKELLLLFFYIIYFIEWFSKSIIYGSTKKGYLNISFEREAYDNQEDYSYLETRKRYAWFKRIIK